MVALDVRMKKLFFDRVEVERRLGAQRTKLMGKCGAYARKVAIRSMRRVGKNGKPSPADSPPRYHGNDPSLRTILFALEPQTERVVVGPIRFNQKQYFGGSLQSAVIPKLHEVGGVLSIREKRVGMEWRPIGKRKPHPDQPTRRRNATYKARPYMKPAQTKTIERFEDVFYGS